MRVKEYTQCKLKSRDNVETVSWIPSHCARKGSWVALWEERKSDDMEMWEVQEVYTTISADALFDMQKQVKNTRKASDI
jgi:uncharacterized cysteine cluster protein YcgN (CxxCxxCC family)